jgi:glycosyltransferase involved in cell wall biosynthesis
MSYFPTSRPTNHSINHPAISHATPINHTPVTQNIADAKNGLSIALLGYRSHPHVGGQGIYLHYLSKALVELGHKVDVFSGPPYPELDSRVTLIRLPSLDLYAHKQPTRALRFKHLISFTDTYEWWSKLSGSFAEPYTFGRRLVRYFKKNNPRYDIIHDNQSLCYGLLTLQKKGFSIISTVHHPITHDRDLALEAATNRTQRWLVRRWYGFLHMQQKVVQELTHVITVSLRSQKDITIAFDRPLEKIHVIPNGIDTEIFRPLAEIPRRPWQIITTTSSDQPIKGLSILLNALALVRVKFPQVRLTVIGKLTENGSTEIELRKLQLEDCVHFLTGISTEQLVMEYANAKCAVVPSLYEGFGLPAGEALACGIPLICSDGGALPEVVGAAAYLVKAGDIAELADALTQLLTNDSLCAQLSNAGRSHSLKHLSWPVVAETLVAYYLSCLPPQSHIIKNLRC